MRTEFQLANYALPKATPEDIITKDFNSFRIFMFFNKEKFILANASKDFIIDFFDFYNSSSLDKSKITIRNKQININRFFNNVLLRYLKECSYAEKKEIMNLLFLISKKYSGAELANKVSSVLINLKKLSKMYDKQSVHESIIPTIKSIYGGRIPIEKYITKQNNYCRDSYFGFIRAIKSGTLTTAKVIIDGKEKRMFFKSQVGFTGDETLTKQDHPTLIKEERILGKGHNELALDPETLEIYSIITKNGKHYGKLAEKSNDLYAKSKERVKGALKKELQNYLNEIYAKRNISGKIIIPGIRRMKETYKRMSSKAR